MNRLRDEMRRRKRQARHVGAFAGDGEQDGQSDPWDTVKPCTTTTDALADDAVERLSRADQADRLRRAIATLSEPEQEILKLRFTAGLSFPDIARTLEQPLGTVLARSHRAVGST
jgi:RNA polymerase sigma-70 factor (ECF subfamily)